MSGKTEYVLRDCYGHRVETWPSEPDRAALANAMGFECHADLGNYKGRHGFELNLMGEQMRLDTCKGVCAGRFAECVAWLQEMQPAFASVVIDGVTQELEPERYHDDWHEAMIVAVDEIKWEVSRCR